MTDPLQALRNLAYVRERKAIIRERARTMSRMEIGNILGRSRFSLACASCNLVRASWACHIAIYRAALRER